MLAKKCSKSFKLDYNSTWTKNFQMHKLYLQKAEEPDQIANICWFIEKKQGNSRKKKKICFCFIYYAKAFDCLDHRKVWKILKDMGITDHITYLLRNLYSSQETTVKTLLKITYWFKIEKGVYQGCILSPVYLIYT